MTPEELIAHFGTQTRAAEQLGVTQGLVSQWLRTGDIPYPRQCQIQIETDGALKASRPSKGEAA